MQGRGGASGPLPEVLEFEGRFMSSRPITNNPLWWHRDQNPIEQQLPDFIPIGNDTGAPHNNSISQAGWDAESLNIGQSSSGSMKNLSGYIERHMENERISYANIYAGDGSNSNSHAYPPNINASNTNLIRPVVVQNSRSEIGMSDFLTNMVSSGHASTDLNATASSSAHPQVEVVRTSSLFREENNCGPESAVMTSHSSEKRKFPEGSWDESSASARKRYVQIDGSSALQTASNCHTPDNALSVSSSSANVLGLGSSGSLRSGDVPLSRSSLLDCPPESMSAGRSQNIQQNTQIRTLTSLQDSVLAHSVLSGTDIRHNSYPVVQRPRLVLPPPQAVGEGFQNHLMPIGPLPHLVLPPPHAVGESSNIQNHPMPVHYPATTQQNSQLTGHHNASNIIPRNPSGSALATGTIQVEEMGLRNSTQSLQRPVIAPPIGSRNSRRNPTNIVPSGGVAVTLVNAGPGLPSDPIPSGPRPVPNLVSNGNRLRGMEQIRQASFTVDSMLGASNPPPREISLQSGANSQGNQTMQQRTTLLQTAGRNHSNFGAPGHNASTNSFDTETRQMLLSQARHMIAIYRGGRDIQAPEDGVNVRQSLLSALASIHDRHRDMRLDVDNMSYEELLELGDRIGHVKVGLSEETIMKCLKHYKYTSTVKSSKPGAEPCSICQEEYAEGDDLGAMDCGHEYHTNCIKQWLVLKNSCPICKAAASTSK